MLQSDKASHQKSENEEKQSIVGSTSVFKVGEKKTFQSKK
jgi:hypothetical protein